MANASTTQASSASETTGTPIPLTYGYAWVTGKRHAYYMLQDTGDDYMDYHRVGIWLLGHGEWDGCTELWINDLLTWESNIPAAAPPGFSGQNWLLAEDGDANFVFNFHPGCDSVIGSGLAPSSSGPDQGVDVLYAQFPSAIQPLAFSRIAYYALMRKQAIQNQTNTHRADPTQWTDINPIGLWRALKCRLFDDEGNQTGYAFTTNPAWHFVDLILRRKLLPDYNLSLTAGPDQLGPAVSNRFDWGSIYQSAQYYDEILANGRRRFQGSYSFVQQTSLQACLEQILLVCRSWVGEYGGKISLNCDMPRSSVFTFSRDCILPGSFEADDKVVHTAGNRYVATMRDLLVPQAAVIASITCVANGRPTVTTEEPHPFNAGDRIAIGGTNTTYDGEWTVYSVPAVLYVGTPMEVDPTTFVMDRKGSNYPTSVGSGGGVGLLYSRFKERSPEFWHKNHMLAEGALGVAIPRQRNKVKHAIDLSITTYDQASRIARYERDRALGVDVSPYVTPPFVKVKTSMFARDAFGNLACAVRPGDHVTVDDTLSFPYAGEYEVIDPLEMSVPTARADSQNGSIQREPDAESGEIAFELGPYNPAIFYDDSDTLQAGWPSVPGSDPGNDSNFTGIDLAGGGIFVFFTGIQASGSQFQLPSTGFPPGNLLDWVGPAGANVGAHAMRVIQLCDADANRNLALIYADDIGNTWGGDVNFAALSWLSPDAPTSSAGMSWLELTLLGGETVLFGEGVLADGTTIVLPAGYSLAKAFAVAYPHDTPTTATHNPRIVGVNVDSGGTVHFTYNDGAGNTWHGNAAVLVFAWKNNMGTVVTETVGAGKWAEITLSNGKKFGVGCALGVADGSTFQTPAAAGAASTLQAIVGSSTFVVPAGAQQTQGVLSCYLDGSNVVHITFGGGGSTTVSGVADVFGLYCESGSGLPLLVTVSPSSASLAAGATQQFTASVGGTANQNVTWGVDGIAGGNVTVGTIDSSGLYSAPATAGSHTVTATSVADPTASGSVPVSIWGSVLTGNILTDDAGNPIYANGDTIDVE
jgi:hypothetical protein